MASTGASLGNARASVPLASESFGTVAGVILPAGVKRASRFGHTFLSSQHSKDGKRLAILPAVKAVPVFAGARRPPHAALRLFAWRPAAIDWQDYFRRLLLLAIASIPLPSISAVHWHVAWRDALIRFRIG